MTQTFDGAPSKHLLFGCLVTRPLPELSRADIDMLARAIHPCFLSTEVLVERLVTRAADTRTRTQVLYGDGGEPVGWIGVIPYSEDGDRWATSTFLTPSARGGGLGWKLKCVATHLVNDDVIVSTNVNNPAHQSLLAGAHHLGLPVNLVFEQVANRWAYTTVFPREHELCHLAELL